jgi:hypothetical protein
MDAVEKGTTSLRKPSRQWNIPLTSLSNHLYGKTRSRKPATNRCTNNKKSSCDFLGFGYARCWVVNKPTTIEDESGKTNPNKANTFPNNTKDLLVVLV